MDLNPRIVDDMGRERYSFGGQTAFKTGMTRGFCWSMEWFIGNRSTEPMLAIWPMGSGRERCGVLGICLSSVGEYLTEKGGVTPAAERIARRAIVEMFDRPALDSTVRNLVAVIGERLPDIILMPPAPRDVRAEHAGQALLEVEMVDESTGRAVSEVEL
jgi:hypothetical protein